jgi:hypothetical protein
MRRPDRFRPRGRFISHNLALLQSAAVQPKRRSHPMMRRATGPVKPVVK